MLPRLEVFMEIGDICIMLKSGSRVEVTGHGRPYCGQKTFVVKRLDTGKEMIVGWGGLELEKVVKDREALDE